MLLESTLESSSTMESSLEQLSRSTSSDSSGSGDNNATPCASSPLMSEASQLEDLVESILQATSH